MGNDKKLLSQKEVVAIRIISLMIIIFFSSSQFCCRAAGGTEWLVPDSISISRQATFKYNPTILTNSKKIWSVVNYEIANVSNHEQYWLFLVEKQPESVDSFLKKRFFTKKNGKNYYTGFQMAFETNVGSYTHLLSLTFKRIFAGDKFYLTFINLSEKEIDDVIKRIFMVSATELLSYKKVFSLLLNENADSFLFYPTNDLIITK